VLRAAPLCRQRACTSKPVNASAPGLDEIGRIFLENFSLADALYSCRRHMPLFKIQSAAIFGIDARLIDVEVDMYAGSARDFIMVGMPDIAVRESRERIKSALLNSGFGYPNKAVTM
jgi:hypothetical protein